MYITARRGGFLWFDATPLGMLGGELDGPTSALNPGETMSNSTVHRRSQLRIIVIAFVLSMSAHAEDHEVRIGRYETIDTEKGCEQLEESVAPEPEGSPHQVEPQADASLKADVDVNVDQAINAAKGNSDEE
jgi:hypothetical protein